MFTKYFFIIFLFLCSCSTLSNKQKFLSTTLLSAGLGFAVGSSVSESNQAKNAILYGGGLGFLGSLLAYSLFNDESQVLELKDKINSLEENFGLTHNRDKIFYLTGGKSYLMEKKLPKEIKEKMKLGTWALYELESNQGTSEWISIGNNKLIKENKLFEFTNPKIKEEL